MRYITPSPANSPKWCRVIYSYININFYVDDGLGSAVSSEAAIDTLSGARRLLSEFNIHFHKIVSNDEAVLDAYQAREVSANVREVGIGSLSTHYTLVVSWNLKVDTLSLQFKLIDRPFTKMGILAAIGLMYDPLGFVVLITLAGRLLLREILYDVSDRYELSGWDTPLLDQLRDKWTRSGKTFPVV